MSSINALRNTVPFSTTFPLYNTVFQSTKQISNDRSYSYPLRAENSEGKPDSANTENELKGVLAPKSKRGGLLSETARGRRRSRSHVAPDNLTDPESKAGS